MSLPATPSLPPSSGGSYHSEISRGSTGNGHEFSIGSRLNFLMEVLPVDLSDFVEISERNPEELCTDNVAQRLILTLLNEQDERISSKNTKLQVMQILHNMVTSARTQKSIMRMILYDCNDWFDDDSVDHHNDDYDFPVFPERSTEIMRTMKQLLHTCWRTEPELLQSLLQDDSTSVQQSKQIIMQNYAAKAMQAVVRGYQGRKRLKKSLAEQSEEQEEEVRQWSILILQKVARGYIARKTVLKSMEIRSTLNKEVLRIAEKYLKHGDLWSFLKDINDELNRSNYVIQENQAREDNWATSFVEKVVAERQNQFNESWERFPEELQKFTGKATQLGALQDKEPRKHDNKKKSSSSSGSNGGGGAKASSQTSSSMKSPSPQKQKQRQQNQQQGAGDGGGKSSRSSKKNTSSTSSITAKEVEFAVAHNDQAQLLASGSGGANSSSSSSSSSSCARKATGNNRASGGPYIDEDGMLVDPANQLQQAAHLQIPGALMRKAVTATVHGEVADQLNRLVNGEFRSRKLTNDFQKVYKPRRGIDYNRGGQQSGASGGGGGKTTTSLAPIQVNKPMGKKKKRIGVNGLPIEDEGKIEAAHSDWLAQSLVETNGASSSSLSSSPGAVREEAFNPHVAAAPGLSLLIDVPQGINDSIERLMHAAALRCYVPDFFQGVTNVTADGKNEEDDEYGDDIDEENLVAISRARILKNAQEQNPNTNASYAYNMYLQMPMGLAKMRYELQCKKYAQGPINRMRVKGLNFLADVSPLSKFVMCMKSVDTPRVLLNKTVDLFVELKQIGKVVPLGINDSDSKTKFARSAQSGSSGTTQLQIANKLSKSNSNPNIVTHHEINQIALLSGDGANPKKSATVTTPNRNTNHNTSAGGGGGGGTSSRNVRFLNEGGDGSGDGDGDGAVVVQGELGFESLAEASATASIEDGGARTGGASGAGGSLSLLQYASEEQATAAHGSRSRTTLKQGGQEGEDNEEDVVPFDAENDEGEGGAGGLGTVASRKLARKMEKFQAEFPSKLLLSMVEDIEKGENTWCDLKATVEDIFLQAAFMVVPHVQYVEAGSSSSSDNHEGGGGGGGGGGGQGGISVSHSSSGPNTPTRNNISSNNNKLGLTKLKSAASGILQHNNNNNNNNLRSSSSPPAASASGARLLRRGSSVNSSGAGASASASRGGFASSFQKQMQQQIDLEQQQQEQMQKKIPKVKIETPMGNAALKVFTADILKMTSDEAKREAIKDRFRASFIMTTPFTLYLHSKEVYIVSDLLKVNLADLQMPSALETQLEVLLTTVVAKCVDAKILPIPRNHLATAEELFTVPMVYDPKFQRSPFDPFGRPPRLQQQGKSKLIQKKLKTQDRADAIRNKAHHNLNKVASVKSIQEDLALPVSIWTTVHNDDDNNINNTNNATTNSSHGSSASTVVAAAAGAGAGGAGAHPSHRVYADATSAREVKAYLQQQQQSPIQALTMNGSSMDLLASVVEEEEGEEGGYGYGYGPPAGELGNAGTIGASTGASAGATGSIAGREDSVVDGKWSFHALPDMHESASLGQHDANAATGTAAAAVNATTDTSSNINNAIYDNKANTGAAKTNARAKAATATATGGATSGATSGATTSGAGYASVKRKNMTTRKKKSLRHDPNVGRENEDFMTRSINDKVFKHSFVCTYPHCGQVFARQYTYNIHLKSHELFGQYHDFKRQPQLHLDKDQAQIRRTAQQAYQQRITLPPMVQGELKKLQR